MANRTLAGLPFVIALKRDAGAVNAQVQRALGAPVGDLDSQCLLSPVQGGMIRHGRFGSAIVRVLAHHGGLLDGQAEWDRRIRECRRVIVAAVIRRETGHVPCGSPPASRCRWR